MGYRSSPLASKRKASSTAATTRQPLSLSKKKTDLLFSRKLVQLHIVLNMPPFDDFNPHFVSFVERVAAAFRYNIGEQEFQQLLAGWNTKAPALLNDEDDIERTMTMMVIWLILKEQYRLAKCFKLQ